MLAARCVRNSTCWLPSLLSQRYCCQPLGSGVLCSRGYSTAGSETSYSGTQDVQVEQAKEGLDPAHKEGSTDPAATKSEGGGEEEGLERLSKEEKLERACLVSAACNAMDEDGVLLKPPSSHESPSLLYDSLANKFINMLMREGKKTQAERAFVKALELIKRTQIAKANKEGKDNVVINPMTIFYQAVENVKPVIATQVVRRGGKPYHVPCSIMEKRRTFLACRWLIMSARQKRGMGVSKKLAIDFIDSYNHQGYAIKKKQDLHRLADANRAYSHFRW